MAKFIAEVQSIPDDEVTFITNFCQIYGIRPSEMLKDDFANVYLDAILASRAEDKKVARSYAETPNSQKARFNQQRIVSIKAERKRRGMYT